MLLPGACGVVSQVAAPGKSEAKGGHNCPESTGRYSLSVDPRRHNILLRIKNVLFMDAERYFCRFELDKQEDAYETSTGTILNIRAVPQTLDSIYIRTLPSGEQFVTCDVKGTPPPTVTWIIPENMNASLVSVQSGFAGASSSIPANLPNTNYTCQIHGKNGTQNRSIYFSGAQEQQQQIPVILLIAFVILSGVFFILFVVTLAVLYKKGKEHTHHLSIVLKDSMQQQTMVNWVVSGQPAKSEAACWGNKCVARLSYGGQLQPGERGTVCNYAPRHNSRAA
ncbi:uncharacterized protein LOC118803898 [Colossoma macropomum]|uniref:uncharacterized protein LOC118803898 n=1 Tax=Colossoma macropomum TaxID=42526 RepID=UPI00186532CB|nr:uncharacterized protein LOC118803898 [Colossoma macropomum]